MKHVCSGNTSQHLEHRAFPVFGSQARDSTRKGHYRKTLETDSPMINNCFWLKQLLTHTENPQGKM